MRCLIEVTMPKCSKKYMALVVTRTGLTPEKPWTSILGINLPSVFEYEEWQLLAEELANEAWRHYVVLGDTETRASGGGHYPHWNRLREEANTMWAQFEELPKGPLVSFDITSISFKDDVEAAIKASVDAVCFMEKVDSAIVEYGVPVPEAGVTPKPPGKEPSREGIGLLGTVGVIAIAGAAVWGVVKYTSRNQPQPVEAE